MWQLLTGHKTATTDRLNLVTVTHLFTDKNKKNTPPTNKNRSQNALTHFRRGGNTPWVGQYNFFTGPRRRRALALLHGHKVADIGQHRLQVRHFVYIFSTGLLLLFCFNTQTHTLTHNSQRRHGRSSHSNHHHDVRWFARRDVSFFFSRTHDVVT